MDVSGSLSEQLSALIDALDDPGTDPSVILSVLVDDLTAAVPSFLGVQITMKLDGRPVTMSAIDPTAAATARASLRLPLDPLAGAGPGSTVTFYAATPGAFVNLAAAVARLAWGLNGHVELDPHLLIELDSDDTPKDQQHHPWKQDQRPFPLYRTSGVAISREPSTNEHLGPSTSDAGLVTSDATNERTRLAADRHNNAKTRHDAADRRQDWADYTGRVDTAQDREAAAQDREAAAHDLDEDRRDRAAEHADAAAAETG